MRHIRSALAAGLLVIGGAAVASAQQSAPTTPAAPQRAHVQRSAHQRAFGKQLYKGIVLSDAEKANVKNVRAKYAAQFKALRGPNVTPEQRAQARQLRVAEQNDLRSALSADHQAKFDANAARIKTRMAKRSANGKRAGTAAPVTPRA